MNLPTDLPLLAYMARKNRLDQGLTLENLKDEHISVGTISNIENMEGNPSESKLYYLFQRLGYDQQGLEELKQRELLEMETLQRKLECVENLLDNQDITQAKKLLGQYQPEEYHALYPYALYLKAQYTFACHDIEKALKLWKKALESCKRQLLLVKQDLVAKCHNEISTCCYRRNNLQNAIYHVEKGLEQFHENEQHEIKFALTCNLIFYLSSAGRLEESYSFIKQIWPSIHQIQSMQVKLHLYKSHCNLLIQNNKLDEAEHCCKESIEITQRNLSQKSLLLDFLNILGSIYLKQREYKQAMEYFYLVLELDTEQKSPRRHADAYTYLTSLYTSQNNWGKTQEYMEHAIKISREIQDDVRLTKTLIVSGICMKKQELYEEAIPYFKEAIALCNKHNYLNQRCAAVYELTGCFDKIGNRSEFSNCAEEFYLLQRKLGWRLEEDLYGIQ